MNNFDGMNRQYPIPKMKEGTWQFARNIILSDKYTSIRNDYGSKKIDTIPGFVIGEIITNDRIVYFSTDLTYSYIGYKKLNSNNTPYINVFKSIYFNFNIDCPIEGISYYNYKNELIIGWCDGVFENSNPPYLLNLDKPNVELNNTNELVNPEDINKLHWFTSSKEPVYEIDYKDSGTLLSDSMHITMSYCFEDGTELFWFPPDTMAYPKTGMDKPNYRTVIINLKDLDINFDYFKIGIISNYNNGSIGYKSDVIKINSHDLHSITLGDFSNLFETSVEELAFTKQVFDKIYTMTLEANQVIVGNVVTHSNDDELLQKYANKLILGIRAVSTSKSNTRADVPKSIKNKSNHPSLLPNEVYSFKIKAKRHNGTYTDSFHIPNIDRVGEEPIPILTLNNLGLNGLLDDSYCVHHILNTSANPTKLDNYNFEFNFGSYTSDELYPNEDIYNSSDVGGEDLRGLNVNYHRVPTLAFISKHMGQGELLNSYYDEILDKVLLFPRIKNLDIIPEEIRNKYQSFTLEIVKRNRGNSIIQDTGLLTMNHIITFRESTLSYKHFTVGHYDFAGTTNQDDINDTDMNQGEFGNASFYSFQTYKNKPVFKKGALVFSNGFINVNRSYPEFYKAVDSKVEIAYNNVNDSIFMPNSGVTVDQASYGVIDSYSYYDTKNTYLNTRFGENFVGLKIKQNKESNTAGVEYYYNPTSINLNNSDELALYGNRVVTYIVPFDGGSIREYKDADVYAFAHNTDRVANMFFSKPTSSLFVVADIVNIKKNIYTLNDSDLIAIGKTKGTLDTGFIEGGDVFVNTKIEIQVTQAIVTMQYNLIARYPVIASGLYSTSNNAVLTSRKDTNKISLSGTVDRYSTYNIKIEEGLNLLNNIDYTVEAVEGLVGDSSRLNDLVGSTIFNVTYDTFINKFPYRVYKSNVIQSETLTTTNVRGFKTDAYYDMPNDRGPIVAIRSQDRRLYIQMKYGLYLSEINDSLVTSEDESVYLGKSLFLDRPPMEVMQNGDLGYIGSQSKFACKIFRDGFISVDMLQGKIFIIGNEGSKEVSTQLMRNYYRDNLKINTTTDRYKEIGLDVVDNPYMGIGIIVAFDNEFERFFISKSDIPNLNSAERNELERDYDFNGESYIHKVDKTIKVFPYDIVKSVSETFSISTETLQTICNHDYSPEAFISTNKDLLYLKLEPSSTAIYKLNNRDTPLGVYEGRVVESYADIIFNTRLDLSKLYQSFQWVTEVYKRDNSIDYNKTLEKIMLYNYHQCSGIIDLDVNSLNLTRNTEGIWQFNEFRDLLRDSTLPIMNSKGELNEDNINQFKYYFNMSNFIGIFIVARVYFRNNTSEVTYLHNINVKSIISKR